MDYILRRHGYTDRSLLHMYEKLSDDSVRRIVHSFRMNDAIRAITPMNIGSVKHVCSICGITHTYPPDSLYPSLCRCRRVCGACWKDHLNTNCCLDGSVSCDILCPGDSAQCSGLPIDVHGMVLSAGATVNPLWYPGMEGNGYRCVEEAWAPCCSNLVEEYERLGLDRPI